MKGGHLSRASASAAVRWSGLPSLAVQTRALYLFELIALRDSLRLPVLTSVPPLDVAIAAGLLTQHLDVSTVSAQVLETLELRLNALQVAEREKTRASSLGVVEVGRVGARTTQMFADPYNLISDEFRLEVSRAIGMDEEIETRVSQQLRESKFGPSLVEAGITVLVLAPFRSTELIVLEPCLALAPLSVANSRDAVGALKALTLSRRASSQRFATPTFIKDTPHNEEEIPK